MGSQGVGHDGATELNQNEFLHVASFSPHKEEIYCPPVSSEKTSSVGEVAAAAAAKSLQLCLTLHDPTDHSTPGFHVYHQLPELAQTHVHRVSDAIEPSHPLLAPSPLALNLPQQQGFSNESAVHIR